MSTASVQGIENTYKISSYHMDIQFLSFFTLDEREAQFDYQDEEGGTIYGTCVPNGQMIHKQQSYITHFPRNSWYILPMKIGFLLNSFVSEDQKQADKMHHHGWIAIDRHFFTQLECFNMIYDYFY